MTDGTSCTGEQTSYCAEIISVDQSGTRDAVLIKHELLNRTKGCANTECIE